MKTACFSIGLAAISAFAVTSTASAAIVSISYSGPGGTGTEGLPGGFGATLTEPRLDYTALDYIDVTITVDSAAQYTINEAPSFGGVRNDSGQDWTGFQLSMAPGIGAFDSNDWSEGGTAFATVNSAPLLISYSNGTDPNNSSQFAPFGHVTTNGAGTFVIHEVPVAAPEPSALVLAGMASLGLSFLRRRR